MKLSDFDFPLPKNLLAERPSDYRDESRLMVLDRKTKTIEHRIFKDVIDYFENDDLMIVNDTKVIPARIFGKKEKTFAKIEVFLLRELNAEDGLWDVLVDPARKIRIGNKLYFDDNLVAEVIDNTTNRGRIIRFFFKESPQEFKQKLRNIGKTPLPKYIKRPAEESDKDRYQTIYAKNEGAVAAPTAGLHFSKHLIKRIKIKGIHFESITLHIGLGTFDSVAVEDLLKHKMGSEQINISTHVANLVNTSLDNKRKICAVGTTVMRTLESSVAPNGYLNPFDGWTNKFIFPPYDFRIANCMITNFHLPKSTVAILTAAFAGYDFLKKAYKEAIHKKYRFYSYGDAMLIL